MSNRIWEVVVLLRLIKKCTLELHLQFSEQ